MQYADGDTIMSQDLSAGSVAPVKRGRGRPSGSKNKVSKTKVVGRATNGGAIAASKKNAARRAVLKEKANEQYATETDELNAMEEDTVMVGTQDSSADELDKSIVAVQPTKRGRPRKTTRPRAGSLAEERAGYSIQEERTRKEMPKLLPTESRQLPAESRNRDKAIPETQQSFAIADRHGDEDIEEPVPRPIARHTSHARSHSRSRQQSIPVRRAGSASDTDRGPGEPAARRKLGELKRKLENLELKYNSLQEIGIKEAEDNYEKLRKHVDERTKGIFLIIGRSKYPADIHQPQTISLLL